MKYACLIYLEEARFEAMTQRAREITESLLSFSKQKPSVMEEARVQDVFSRILPVLEREFAKDSVRIVQNLDAGTPTTLLNVGRFEEVLVNILINARQAIVRDGTITIDDRWSVVAFVQSLGLRQ